MTTHQSADTPAILQAVASLGTIRDYERIGLAYRRAKELYGQEGHWSDVTILDHVLGVLKVLLPFQPDEDGIIACLLHHCLQKNRCTLPQLEQEFGPRVRSIVSGIHLLSHVSGHRGKNTIDELRLMLLTVAQDLQTILIILCDRCHLLSIASDLPRIDAERLGSDVLNLFAPVAARLGMYGLKHQLESKAFALLYPEEAKNIHERVTDLQKQYGPFLETVAEQIRSLLSAHGIAAEVEARQKQPYSTFRKLHQKSVSGIEGIYDLFAIRIIVETTADCYQSLGLVHGLGRPLASRFKDYIAFPKPNGYQSLHTAMMGLPGTPENIIIEIQIRTSGMHQEAEFGIAAHWMYKEGGQTSRKLRTMALAKALTEQEAILGDEATGHSFTDHIYVLTPRGDIIELPEGATPLDFAFQIHTDLGLAVRSAKVNGAIVPLQHELQNGDIVEIQKHHQPSPSPQWLSILKMSSSRSKLKRYLYSQNRESWIAEGRRLLNEELQLHGKPRLTSDLTLLKRIQDEDLSLSQREDLLMKIGQGSEKSGPILQKIFGSTTDTHPPASPPLPDRPDDSEKPALQLEGRIALPTRLAQCCKPNPAAGKPIIGVINRRGFVMIHDDRCRMLKNVNPDRRIGALWQTVGSDSPYAAAG